MLFKMLLHFIYSKRCDIKVCFNEKKLLNVITGLGHTMLKSVQPQLSFLSFYSLFLVHSYQYLLSKQKVKAEGMCHEVNNFAAH